MLRLPDIAMGVAVALIWGMGIVFAKAAIGHFPPILLMALRFLVTALILVWFVRPPVGMLGRICLIALVSAAIQYSLTFNGLRGVDASTAVLVIQLEVPFLVLLGAIFLQERPGLREWGGIAAAFVGVALIAGEPRWSGAWGSLLLLTGGAFTWAIGQAMIRRLGAPGGFTLVAWVAIFATPQLFLISLVVEGNPLPYIAAADWRVWSTVAYLGIVMTALGYGLWYTLIGRHPVSLVGPFLLLLPVFSVIGGFLLLDERMTPQEMLGGVIVILGIAIILLTGRRAPPAAPEPVATEDN